MYKRKKIKKIHVLFIYLHYYLLRIEIACLCTRMLICMVNTDNNTTL